MLTDIYDDKTGPLYSTGQRVYTIDKGTDKKVWGEIIEVGEESIVVRWEDFEEDTEYERQKIELIGEQIYENERKL